MITKYMGKLFWMFLTAICNKFVVIPKNLNVHFVFANSQFYVILFSGYKKSRVQTHSAIN